MPRSSFSIATENEGPLHRALKQWYWREGDRVEVPVQGKQIDLVRDGLLIEIQTRSLSAIRDKLEFLLESHSVRLVYPVILEKYVVRIEKQDGSVIGRRRSPKKGRVEDLFEELIGFPHLLAHPRFSFEALCVQVDEVREHQPGQVFHRKGWRVVERRLLKVLDRHLLESEKDLLAMLPEGLATPFTTADLARSLSASRELAQKMAYCLREAGAIQRDGKRGRFIRYRLR